VPAPGQRDVAGQTIRASARIFLVAMALAVDATATSTSATSTRWARIVSRTRWSTRASSCAARRPARWWRCIPGRSSLQLRKQEEMVAAILGPIGFDGRTDDRGDGAFKGDEWRHNAAISDLSPPRPAGALRVAPRRATGSV